MTNLITRYFDRIRVSRYRKQCQTDAARRLAEDVKRRRNSEQVTSYRVRRLAALKASRGNV